MFRCANASTSEFASVANTDDAPNFATAILDNAAPHPNSITDLFLNID
jgi:hypothetical protein